MNNLIEKFKLIHEKEDYQTIIKTIENGVVFRGTNLWILVFAIFVASLGLNVNSTAVIIGAMLISPLMGPIMGLGLGMGINDLALLRKSFFNYIFAAGIGLATSTVYFFLSPLYEAHSEILARTSPNIYDVLIAFFGGLAGIVATSSKLKGNVIPGVAIATALMPPLCTAGYGLATLQFTFFFGAFYLFIINSVFIALATLITVRLLKLPFKHLPEPKDELKTKRIIASLVIITLLPSIYFGYDIVQQNKFSQNANRFIDNEAAFPNDYLLKKVIDPKKKSIVLTYGGKKIEDSEINQLKGKQKNYELEKAILEVRQGFAYLNETKDNEQQSQLTLALTEKENELQSAKAKIDSISNKQKLNFQVYNEVKAQYPNVTNGIIQTLPTYSDNKSFLLVLLTSNKRFSIKEKNKLMNWLKIRTQQDSIKIIFEK